MIADAEKRIVKMKDKGFYSLEKSREKNASTRSRRKAGGKNEKKMLFLDIGLVKQACNLDLSLLMAEDLFLVNDGALAEQFVGQELLAYTGKDEMNALYSWVQEERGSNAEIDYLISIDSLLVPIEVKARSIGSLRSLKLFQTEKKVPIGVRVSSLPFALSNGVLSLPFCLLEELPRLVKEAYTKGFA